jgi:hypothetical protein
MKKVAYTNENGQSINIYETGWFRFGYDGHFNLFFISIYDINDTGLIQHEATHFNQYKRDGFKKFVTQFFDPDYKLDIEAEAYAKQRDHEGKKSTLSNHFIAYKIKGYYKFNIIQRMIGKILGYKVKYEYTIPEILEKMKKYE